MRHPLLLLGVASACHQNAELPSLVRDDATRSAIVIGVEGEEVQWVLAHDLAPEFPPFVYEGSPDLYALTFGCSLERVGVTPGLQSLTMRPESRIVAPRSVRSAPIDGDRWEEVESSALIDDAIARLPVADKAECDGFRAHFEPRRVTLPPDGRRDAAFIESLSDGRTLVGSMDGRAYLVSPDGSVERVAALEERRYLGAHRMDNDQLWLLSDKGVLVRGRIGAPFQVVTSTAPLPELFQRVSLAGPPNDDSPFELFVTANKGEERVMARFDGIDWTPIVTNTHQALIFLPAATWIGPRHGMAIGVGALEASAVRWDDGKLTDHALPTVNRGAASILHHPTLGTIIGMDDGSIVRSTGGDFSILEGGPAGFFVRTLMPLGDGILFGTGTEVNFLGYRYGQYHPSVGFCSLDDFTEEAASYIGPIGDDGILLSTLGSIGAPLSLTILDRVGAIGECSAP